jgi:hypothetical protein
MLSTISIQSNENIRSAIVNCLCPECGGAIELHSNQLRCLGRCGKASYLGRHKAQPCASKVSR